MPAKQATRWTVLEALDSGKPVSECQNDTARTLARLSDLYG
ncbi:hypothetical protein ACIQYQ_04105 [Pseudomonas asiatica]